MASSIVHLAITNELIKRYSFSDVNRLKYGAVIVDAGYNGNSPVALSHWQCRAMVGRQSQNP